MRAREFRFRLQGRQPGRRAIAKASLIATSTMFVPRVVNMRLVDDDIFVRWKRKPNMDLESECHGDAYGIWRDNGYATSRDALIVSLSSRSISFSIASRAAGDGNRSLRRWISGAICILFLLSPSRFAAMPIRFSAEWLHRRPPEVASHSQ